MLKSANAKQGAALAALLLVVTGVVAAVASCYGPTEVRLEISRDAPCAAAGQGVTGIFVGAEGHGPVDPIAETTDCTPADTGSSIGSLVVVPSGDRDGRATIEVALALTPKVGRIKSTKECLVDATDCIVARRTFSFIAHQSRTIPIRLYEECRGIACAAGKTCIAGKCGSDNLDSPAFCERASCDDAVAPEAGGPPNALCRGPAGDDVLTAVPTGPLGKLQANGTTLFWRSGDGTAIDSVRKDGSNRGVVFAPGGITAMAVGENGQTGWVAANARMYKLPLLVEAGAPVGASDMAFATAPVVAIAAPGQNIYFSVATATFRFSGTPPANPYSVPRSSATTSASANAASVPAARLAARATPASETAYGLNPFILFRHNNGNNTADPITLSGATDVLAVPGGAYVSELKAIGFVADSALVSTPVAAALSPDSLAYDGKTLFWIQPSSAKTAGADRILRLEGDAGVPVALPEQGKMVGLVVDERCVYYWADGAIRVAPKGP